jgi:AcrR family transcriptional regulator
VNSVQYTLTVQYVKMYDGRVGATERREREKSEFREEVLRAARAIIAKEGFEALSMRKIAEAIEYAPGTIYLYFESRDAIAKELTQRGFVKLLEAFAPAVEIADPVKRLEEIGKRYVRFGLEQPETYRLIFMEKYSETVFDDKDENSPGHRALQLLVDTVDQLKAQKRFNLRVDSWKMAEAIWASMHGIVSLKLTCSSYPETPAEELGEIMTNLIFNGLLKA